MNENCCRIVPMLCLLALSVLSCGDGGDDSLAPAYDVEVRVSGESGEPGEFGALQIEITHLGNSGGFIGRDDGVDCVSLVEVILAANFSGERVVKAGLISLGGIQYPATVMRCGFRTREELLPASFSVAVVDAADTNSDPLDPPPAAFVGKVSPR